MDKKIENSKYCDMCGENATSLCFKCAMYFCDSCYKLVHNMKKNSNHKKEKIDYFIPIDMKCPIHPKDRINLFCVDENGKKIFYIIFIFYYK